MKTLSLMILVSTMLLLGFTQVNGSEWLLYAVGRLDNNNYYDNYYDKESIVSDGKGAIKVWTKIVFFERGQQDYIRDAKEKGFYKETYEDISYRLDLENINCNTREYRTIFFDQRDETGGTIGSNQSTGNSWRSIPPDSPVESLYNEVCNGESRK